jgi:hypothetical protein
MQRFWIRIQVVFCLLAVAALMLIAAAKSTAPRKVLEAPPLVAQSNLAGDISLLLLDVQAKPKAPAFIHGSIPARTFIFRG